MKTILLYFTILFRAFLFAVHGADELVVYPPVPGLAASEHYKVRVRAAVDGGIWQDAFALQTDCKSIEKSTDAYFDHLAGWTHTYVNFETAGAVEIEISRANGQPIRSGAVHPQRKASACIVKDGRVFVRLDKPCLVAVDVDGQMDGQDTGKGYKGHKIEEMPGVWRSIERILLSVSVTCTVQRSDDSSYIGRWQRVVPLPMQKFQR